MSRPLPGRPNLEYLRKQAKELLPELRQRDPEARLADAQHAVACGYGFVNWAALKTHVETVQASRDDATPPGLGFAGRWIANLARSRRHPANPFQRATLEVAVDGNVVTIADCFVDESGRETCGNNTIHVDGIERVMDHGYVVRARWRGSHALDVIVTQSDAMVGRATYEVSGDGRVLTTSDLTGDQVIVLDREGE